MLQKHLKQFTFGVSHTVKLKQGLNKPISLFWQSFKHKLILMLPAFHSAKAFYAVAWKTVPNVFDKLNQFLVWQSIFVHFFPSILFIFQFNDESLSGNTLITFHLSFAHPARRLCCYCCQYPPNIGQTLLHKIRHS